MLGNDACFDRERETTGDFVVCLGASAGGLEALRAFLSGLPPESSAAFVVVVHLSPDFESLMPELLARSTGMPVQAATDGVAVDAGRVYIIPPGQDMSIVGGHLRLSPQDRLEGHGLHLPIDGFLTSLAKERAGRSVAVILSGTGSDGSRGIRRIKDAGGVVFVQSPESAQFDGMPLSALQTGIVDQSGIPRHLAESVNNLVTQEKVDEASADAPEAADFDRIVRLLSATTGVNATHYRHKMLRRRVKRRMAIEGMRSIQVYRQRLERDRPELNALAQDLMIGVTSFFRDPDAFRALRTELVERVLPKVPDDETIRVWVTAASVGMEVYSIAILLLEALRELGRSNDIKLFATDVNERALERASEGEYARSDALDVPAELLARYFEPDGDHFVVRSFVRGKVVFARHDLTTDAPFVRMHLVTCRNLLIYLEPRARDRALYTLYSALRPGLGVLFLGMSEEPGPVESGLECVDGLARVFRHSGKSLARVAPLGMTGPAGVRVLPSNLRHERFQELQQEAQQLRRVLELSFEAQQQSAALIDPQMRLLDVITDPIGVFRLPKGRPTTELARILESGQLTALTIGLQRLKSGEGAASYRTAPKTVGGDAGGQVVEVFRLGEPDSEPLLLIIRALGDGAGAAPPAPVPEEAVERVLALEAELRQTRESLQSTIEELQVGSEEQQSTNEELVSANEELQSTNEELYMVNSEFRAKNNELQIMTADLDNLLDSINVATLYLDEALRVRKFNAAVTELIALQSIDLGRPVSDITHWLDSDLTALAREVLKSRSAKEVEIRDRRGAWRLMRVSHYVAAVRDEEGVLITFVDISGLKNAEVAARVVTQQLHQSNQQLRTQAAQLEDLFSIVAHDLRRPVVAIDGFLTLAEEESGAGDAREHIKSAATANDQLRMLLDDLGRLGKLGSEPAVFEVVEVGEWLSRTLRPFAARAAAEGVALHWVGESGAFAIPHGPATAIVANLVENALIHGAGGVKPRIEVNVTIAEGSFTIRVSDNGLGIAPEHHERVFEPFRRLRPGDGKGTGIGLVAVRRLADRLGGTISLKSAVGQGAQFEVVLPVPIDGIAGDGGPTILFVEDDPGTGERVSARLGSSVQRAGTLREAKALLDVRRYRLILLDMSLPDGHGMTLTTQLGALNRTTPIVAVLDERTAAIQDLLQLAQVRWTIDRSALDTGALTDLIAKVTRRMNELPAENSASRR